MFSPYVRRSLVIYDFAPDPSKFPNTVYEENIIFFFISAGSSSMYLLPYVLQCCCCDGNFE
jgi:hypothetical protein